MKNNFKIALDDVSFMLLVKKCAEIKIAQLFGYDEEVLKDNEKVFVASILKEFGGKNEIKYKRSVQHRDMGSICYPYADNGFRFLRAGFCYEF